MASEVKSALPVWLKTVIIASLNLALPWLQSHASATIVAIVEEIIAFLQANAANMEQSSKDLLAHVQKVTRA